MKIPDLFVKYILFIFVFTISLISLGQGKKTNSKSNLMVELKGEYGFLLSHHLELDKFQSHFPAFEFSIEKQTYGKQYWESKYAFPIIGLSLWYSPIGGFEAIGSAIALYPFINFPLIKNDVQSLNFRLGVGVGYLTKNFQRLDNYKNFAIGSHINVAGRLFLEYRRKLNRLISIATGFGLTHFSNGSFKNPNYGLNMLTGTVSVAIFLQQPKPNYFKKTLPELYPFEFDGRKYLDADFSFALARKNMNAVYGKSFIVYGGYVNLLKRVSYKSAFGLGLDLVYDGSDVYYLEFNGTPAKNGWQILKPGVNVAYELLISRVSLLINFGVYLSGADHHEGDMYQRFSLRYRFSRHYFAQLVLGSNFAKAEYVGLGLGYRFDFVYKRKVKHSR